MKNNKMFPINRVGKLFYSGSSAGITLVELVFVTALTGVFAVLVFSLFSGARNSQDTLGEDLQMQSRALLAQNEIIRIVREGQNFVVPVPGEDSSMLCFIDKTSDLQVLYPTKDEALSKKLKKDVFKLMLYQVDVEKFNIASPVFDKDKSRIVSTYIKTVMFRLSSAGSTNVTIAFESEKRPFQIMFECGLMNAGEL